MHVRPGAVVDRGRGIDHSAGSRGRSGGPPCHAPRIVGINVDAELIRVVDDLRPCTVSVGLTHSWMPRVVMPGVIDTRIAVRRRRAPPDIRGHRLRLQSRRASTPPANDAPNCEPLRRGRDAHIGVRDGSAAWVRSCRSPAPDVPSLSNVNPKALPEPTCCPGRSTFAGGVPEPVFTIESHCGSGLSARTALPQSPRANSD